jgi:hypothetical protein
MEVAMKRFRRTALLSLLACTSACGGGGGGGGGGDGGGVPNPLPPPGPAITSPLASVLPAGAPGLLYTSVQFTASGTAPFSWSIVGGFIPPGMTFAADGLYSGTPLSPGNYIFSVRVTDANGIATSGFSHVILASLPESEPNNTSGTADVLQDGLTGTGSLGAGDVDYWTFAGTADDVIQIELFGTRRDFAAFEVAGSIPKLSVFGPNGTSFLVGHDVQSLPQVDLTTGWVGGQHDMDIPAFRIPTTGNYFLRIEPDLAASGGSYAVRFSSLLLGTVQAESEPNDDFANATAITPGTIQGFHGDEDVDFYSFDISAPTIVTFEIFCYRNGIGGVAGSADDDYFDPQVVIIGPDETTVISGNDDVHFFDSKIACLLGTSGTYFVLVLESDFQTAGDSEYVMTFDSLAVGTLTEAEPNDDTGSADPIQYGDVVSGFADATNSDVDAFVFSGNAGDMVHVYWHDLGQNDQSLDFVDVFIFSDVPSVIGQTVSFWGVAGENATRAILPASGTYFVVVFPFGVDTNYTFQLQLLKESTFETTGNDTRTGAEPIPGSGNVAGVIPIAGDVDVFSFQASEGEVIAFAIHAGPPMVPPGSGGYVQNFFSATGELELLPDLEILNSAGTVLTSTPAVSPTAFCTGEALAYASPTSGIAFVAPSTGTFYIRVSSNDGNVSLESLYFLEQR